MDSFIVVTGGAGALGSALVRECVARGSKVLALDIAAAAEPLRALETELGTACIGRVMDVTDATAWKNTLDSVRASAGEVTGAALIAGTWQGGKALHELTDDAVLHAMVTRNLETTHSSLRALLPGMVARRSGSIVVVGSRAVERPWTGSGATAYTASKAAVVAMAQAAAAEVLDFNVRINAVLPSTIDTRANRNAMPDVDPNKWVSTASLSKVIAFLLSDDARDVSGAALPVYGHA